MVYVKRVELSRFKSFGGSNAVPFLPGFTVISGPNGSGKSNILDALLFCLGLASSKGMRADRLPDLINNSQNGNGRSLETIVSVTFDLDNLPDLDDSITADNQDNQTNTADEEETNNHLNLTSLTELKITRRLRVTKSGSYTSTFYLNDSPCSASDLQTQLNRLRIYPQGYNIVLQGDVTRIITMNAKQRREIIDELAGVAEFDRKIEQTRATLDTVKEREEKCHIIESELQQNSERLKKDSEKAAKYQKLKAQIQEKKQWEIVINWRYLQEQEKKVEQNLIELENEQSNKHQALTQIAQEIVTANDNLTKLNQEVKALGEEEQISIASKLATQKAKRQQLQQRQTELIKLEQEVITNQGNSETQLKDYQQQLVNLSQEKANLEQEVIPQLEQSLQQVKTQLENTKKQAQEIASQSQAYVEQQTQFNQQINQLQQELNPRLTRQALLQERCEQLQATIKTENQQLEQINTEIEQKRQLSPQLNTEITEIEQKIQTLATNLTNLEADVSLSQETVNRLQLEQRDKQRQLDKLEATRQAQQEAQGTYASKIILNSDLPGVFGLVAQLGQVDSAYQLALEISAGSRLGYIVVEDDTIASAGIKLLKQQRAGRATFLPLNKIKPPRLFNPSDLIGVDGFIDLAVNLIDCEPQFQPIFAYVFGNTVVFNDLDSARQFIGEYRMVTLDGELLESSGAMTGGSLSQRSSLHFGRVISSDNAEMESLSDRLSEIEDIVIQFNLKISEKRQQVKELTEELNFARQQQREKDLMRSQLTSEIQRLEQQQEKITATNASNYQQLVNSKQELTSLEQNIPSLQTQLAEKQEQLKELEASFDNQEWQLLQEEINQQELLLEQEKANLSQGQNNLQKLINKLSEIETKIQQSQEKLQELTTQQIKVTNEQIEITEKVELLNQEISNYQDLFQQLAQKLESIKQSRDEQEKELKQLENQQQKINWALEKLIQQHQEKQSKLSEISQQLETITQELPSPLPDIPWLINHPDSESSDRITFDNLQEQLEQIKKEIEKTQKKLEALEPVNMLALEEYEKNQERLGELSTKLETLKGERTELLLRVENFTTLRLRAFKEAFDAVNENFKNIFATLSDGDGYLKLEDEENPFNGGLTLVAHPKGKPVTRLSSMSGGEKSLTALSFIFALQRYRPSPFYAFDEVDMFLDGANVEKLAKMIQKQAESAQFIVVSLRRPMIESAQRTIGVTQARGAYTQVLGIKL